MTCWWAGLPQIFQGTRAKDVWFRMWNLDAFAQDSWKLRSNLTLEYGLRVGYWTNNAELNGLGNWFDPSTYDPAKGAFTDPPYDTQLNGVRYAARGQAPLGVLPNRSPFALPRVNAAWDIHGNGVSVLRGGYGMFANRPRGSVEAGPALNTPPNAYHVGADAFYATSLDERGLTYDTFHLIPFQALLGSQIIQTPTPTSFTFPRTDSYSVSFARRVFWNQVVEAAYVGTRGRHLVELRLRKQRRAVRRAEQRRRGKRRSLGARQPRRPRSERRERPPAVPGSRADLHERLRGPLTVRLAASHAEPPDRQAAAVPCGVHARQGTGHVERRVSDRDPFDPSRTYGVLDEDRRHIFNLSWNALLPDGSRVSEQRVRPRACWTAGSSRESRRSRAACRIHLSFSGDAAGNGVSQAYFGTPDVVGPAGPVQRPRAGVHVRPAARRIACRREAPRHRLHQGAGLRHEPAARPALRHAHAVPHEPRPDAVQELRAARRAEAAVPHGFLQHLQHRVRVDRVGNDMDLTLDTRCNRRVDHVPNGIGGYADGVCDPGRRLFVHGRARERTSGRSTSSAATASSSSC